MTACGDTRKLSEKTSDILCQGHGPSQFLFAVITTQENPKFLSTIRKYRFSHHITQLEFLEPGCGFRRLGGIMITSEEPKKFFIVQGNDIVFFVHTGQGDAFT